MISWYHIIWYHEITTCVWWILSAWSTHVWVTSPSSQPQCILVVNGSRVDVRTDRKQRPCRVRASYDGRQMERYFTSLTACDVDVIATTAREQPVEYFRCVCRHVERVEHPRVHKSRVSAILCEDSTANYWWWCPARRILYYLLYTLVLFVWKPKSRNKHKCIQKIKTYKNIWLKK